MSFSMMRRVRIAVDFLVATGLVISFAAIGVVFVCYGVVRQAVDLHPVAIAFSLVLFTYGVNKLTDFDEDKIDNTARTSIVEVWGHVPVIVGGLILVFEFFYSLYSDCYASMIIAYWVVVGFAYSKLKLKKVFLLKNFIVGSTWASLVCLVYVYSPDISLGILLLLFVNIGVHFFVNSILSDVKDVKSDRESGVVTFPVKYGLSATKWICTAAMLLLVLADSFLLFSGMVGAEVYPLLAVSLWWLLLIPFVKQQYGSWFFGGVVDSEYIVAGSVFALIGWFIK